MKLVAGELDPVGGTVDHHRQLRIARYHQHFDELLPSNQTPVQFLMHAYSLQREEEARKILGQFGLPSEAHKIWIGDLSGGQKARVVFASVTLAKPHLLIFDEPTNHLDIETVDALCDAIKRFTGGLLVVTHNVQLIQAAECELWVCRGAKKQQSATFDKLNSINDYKREVFAQIERRQQKAAQRAHEREQIRAAERRRLLGRLSKPFTCFTQCYLFLS